MTSDIFRKCIAGIDCANRPLVLNIEAEVRRRSEEDVSISAAEMRGSGSRTSERRHPESPSKVVLGNTDHRMDQGLRPEIWYHNRFVLKAREVEGDDCNSCVPFRGGPNTSRAFFPQRRSRLSTLPILLMNIVRRFHACQEHEYN